MMTESAFASLLVWRSAPRYGTAEDVRVIPVVVPELELGDVQRQILCADLVERAHDAAFHEAPEAVNGLGMDCADHILLAAVAHGLVREIRLQSGVASVFVGGEQINLCRDGLADETLQGFGVGAMDHAGNHIAFAPDSASHDQLADSAASARSMATMLVLGLATDIGLISFNNAHQLAELRINQPGTDAMAHVMSGTVRAEAHHPLHFKGRNPFLGSHHHVDDTEPIVPTSTEKR